MELFPRKAPGRFRRIDLEGDDWERAMATLEAIASGYTHITNAVLSTSEWMVRVELLVRDGDNYSPVIVSDHRVARPHERACGVSSRCCSPGRRVTIGEVSVSP